LLFSAFFFWVSESQVTTTQWEENETAVPDVSHSDAAPQQDTVTTTQALHHKPKKRDAG